VLVGEPKRTALRSRTVKNLDEGSGELPRDLADALADLADASEEAREDGLPIPEQQLLDASEQILRKLYDIWPHRFEVYPSPDGEIAIDARNDRGAAVLVLCEPGGEVLCLVHTHGEQQSNRYPSTEDLPDDFLSGALASLEYASG
jgi:hypothetical protein